MSDRRTVDCEEHGQVAPAFVCHHLVSRLRSGKGPPIGFFEPSEPSDDLQAWCGECERVATEAGGWNDESERFARVTLVCAGCFETLRRLEAQ
jgi:hypothetical protein